MRALFTYSFANLKKIIPIKSQKITITQQPIVTHQPPTMLSPQVPNNQWENMSFDALCRIPIVERQAIIYHLKKYKFNHEQLNKIISNQQSQPHHLNPYDQKWCNLLGNKASIAQQDITEGSMTQIQFDDPLQDQQLFKNIKQFITFLSQPQKLQGVGQASLNRYLLGVKRDLMVKGVKLEPITDKASLKLLKPLSYQHQFWVDVHQNRNKNQNRQQFIIYHKQIQNPNPSIVIKQQYPIVKIKYIVKKQRTKNYKMNFCSKLQLLISIDDFLHKVKVQWKIASMTKHKSIQSNRKYLIIDFDGILKGNPTIKPIFNF